MATSRDEPIDRRAWVVLAGQYLLQLEAALGLSPGQAGNRSMLRGSQGWQPSGHGIKHQLESGVGLANVSSKRLELVGVKLEVNGDPDPGWSQCG